MDHLLLLKKEIRLSQLSKRGKRLPGAYFRLQADLLRGREENSNAGDQFIRSQDLQSQRWWEILSEEQED